MLSGVDCTKDLHPGTGVGIGFDVSDKTEEIVADMHVHGATEGDQLRLTDDHDADSIVAGRRHDRADPIAGRRQGGR